LPCITSPQRQQGFFGGEMVEVISLAGASGWYFDPISFGVLVAVGVAGVPPKERSPTVHGEDRSRMCW
jgi:hypothetical protein